MRRLALLLLLTGLLVSQSEVEITAEPHHHFVLSNRHIRVFNVEVPSHSETLMHWHRHDYIFVTLGDADLTNEVSGKPSAELKLTDGETRFSPGPFSHRIQVLSDKPFRNVTIELLQDEALRKSSARWDQDRGLQILSHGTKEILFVKDRIRVSTVELQQTAQLPTDPHAAAQLVVALTDCNLMENVVGRLPSNTVLKTGEVKWIPATTRILENVGPHLAKFITLEVPKWLFSPPSAHPL